MSEWISVKDRLPEDAAAVLGYYGVERDGKLGWMFMGVMHYTPCKQEPQWHFNGKVDPDLRVTHWMPLPEPPEEET